MKPGRGALTLAEILLATGLLAVSVLTTLTVFGLGLRLSSQSREAQVATQLASSVLERAIGGDVTLPVGPVSFDGQAPDHGFPPAPYPQTQVGATLFRVKVRSTPDAALVGLYTVRVEVSWSADKSVVLSTQCHQP